MGVRVEAVRDGVLSRSGPFRDLGALDVLGAFALAVFAIDLL
jgi:hypothetical protein